jgi:hypothetical protein
MTISPDTRIERGDVGVIPDCDVALEDICDGLRVQAQLIVLDACTAHAAVVGNLQMKGA